MLHMMQRLCHYLWPVSNVLDSFLSLLTDLRVIRQQSL
jgi:hypothetical protein